MSPSDARGATLSGSCPQRSSAIRPDSRYLQASLARGLIARRRLAWVKETALVTAGALRCLLRNLAPQYQTVMSTGHRDTLHR